MRGMRRFGCFSHRAHTCVLLIYREMAETPDCPEALLAIQGKTLHGVLCGGQIKPVNPAAFSKSDIEAVWRDRGFRWQLVNGDDLGVGDSRSDSADFSS